MVVSPFEALADVGYTWETWGGIWGSDRDPVHFEYPVFSPSQPPSESIHDWILRTYGRIPWWIGWALPAGTTIKDAAHPATTAILDAWFKENG
jgi:hypothetical protein